MTNRSQQVVRLGRRACRVLQGREDGPKEISGLVWRGEQSLWGSRGANEGGDVAAGNAEKLAGHGVQNEARRGKGGGMTR